MSEIIDTENVTEINVDAVAKMEGEIDMEDAMDLMDWQTMGLHMFSERVRDSWDSQYEYGNGWIVEIFGDYVVVRKNKEHWKVPYSMDGDTIKFGEQNEWSKVKLQAEWVEKAFCIKSLGKNRVGGYAVLWGDETKKDLDGEYFTKETEELDVIFKALGVLPFMYNHGKNKTIKSQVIGAVDILKADDDGLWFEAEIKNHDLYRKYVSKLVGSSKLFTSTQTFASTKSADHNTGYIGRWPIAEITGTPHPAEWRMLEVPISELSKSYQELELDEDKYMKLFNLDSVNKTDQSQESEEDAQVEKSKQLASRLKLEIKQRQLKMRLNKYN